MVQEKNPEAASIQRRKLLLVEAEPSVQGLMSTFLLTMGWTCTVVQDKEEVPALLQREGFDAVVIDLGQSSEADAERVILKIKQIRPSLGDRMIAIGSNVSDRKMVELMERHDFIKLSQEGLLPQLWGTLQELFTPRSRELPPRATQMARMIFDSFRYPLSPGVRSSFPGARQVAYQHKKTIIDVSIELAEGSGRMSLAGQVLDGERKGKNEGLSVLLVSGKGTLARTATNSFGEFQVECEFPEDVSLEIRLGERSWVLVPLGKMDWARERMTS